MRRNTKTMYEWRKAYRDKEVSDMNLNRMEYDEERYEYAMDRMDVIRKKIQEYHEQMNKC